MHSSIHFNLLNEHENCLSVGTAQCSVQNADQIKINEHAFLCPHVLVANKNTIDVSKNSLG